MRLGRGFMLAAVLALAGCGGGSDDDAAESSSAASAPDTTDAPESTTTSTTAPATPLDVLSDAASSCENDSGATKEAADATIEAEDNGPSALRRVLDDVAADNDVTVSEFLTDIWTESFILDSDGSLTMDSIYEGYDTDQAEQYWDDLTPIGTFKGFAWQCLQSELDIPARVTSHIESTRALDGTQTESWDGLEARWTYHPDSGLSITIYPEE